MPTVSLDPDPDPEEGVVESSDIAVVGIAFGAAPDETAPNGMRPVENRDEVEPRDAREPGRRGDACERPWLFVW